MDCSMPGFLALPYLPEFTQTHVHWVSDAIQPSHPLLPPSPALNLSQHQGLFQWVSSSHQVVQVLELQLQHQSFQWISKVDFLQDWLVWSPCSPRDSQESSPTPQSKSVNSLAISLLYGPTLTSLNYCWKNCNFYVSKLMSLLFNMLSRFVTAFLLRSKCLLISWLQSLSAVILDPQKRKFVTASTFLFHLHQEAI